MIEHRVVFAAGHKGETTHVGEHGPGAILSIEPQQGALLWELVCREIATDGREALAQFRSVATVAAVAKRAEPLESVGLADDGARPHHLPTLAPGVARGTDVIQPAKGRRQVSVWGKARCRAASRVPSRSKTTQVFPARSTRPPVCFSLESVGRGRLSRSSRKSVRRASTGSGVNAAKKRESVERAGNWSRSNKAMNGPAKGWSRW